jgi:hypothetical protein
MKHGRAEKIGLAAVIVTAAATLLGAAIDFLE